MQVCFKLVTWPRPGTGTRITILIVIVIAVLAAVAMGYGPATAITLISAAGLTSARVATALDASDTPAS